MLNVRITTKRDWREAVRKRTNPLANIRLSTHFKQLLYYSLYLYTGGPVFFPLIYACFNLTWDYGRLITLITLIRLISLIYGTGYHLTSTRDYHERKLFLLVVSKDPFLLFRDPKIFVLTFASSSNTFGTERRYSFVSEQLVDFKFCKQKTFFTSAEIKIKYKMHHVFLTQDEVLCGPWQPLIYFFTKKFKLVPFLRVGLNI